ncbi:MAG: tRNA glutamyl-Q(34) synthetase GluQRS, partial [Pseudomonadales bacterium]|nr:tRNA glutamyl-Q(34) synthetase GluQRS [Pseudomonadales bacterium]
TGRDALYEAALEKLVAADSIFYCDCTRKKLRAETGPYAGYCRARRHCAYRPATAQEPASHAIRFDTSGLAPVTFQDRILGAQQFDLQALGDFIVRRRDSLFAYQLAVVVDDAEQAVTDIVRGADLLDSTPWQIALQRVLGLATPRYAHLPLLVHAKDAAKLSKQTGATALDDRQAPANLLRALAQLGQSLPWLPGAGATRAPLPGPAEILAQAVRTWDCQRIPQHAIIAGT